MQKSLYFICPTDCLETVINHRFKQKNYFYTSLGNSFNADNKTVERIQCVVQKHRIRKICFVLSNDNKIIEDALHHQDFSDMNGLRNFYAEISKQRKKTAIISKNKQFTMLSYFLNKKIQELEINLASILNFPIEIFAKVYDRDCDTFTPVYSNLVCLEKHQLN